MTPRWGARSECPRGSSGSTRRRLGTWTSALVALVLVAGAVGSPRPSVAQVPETAARSGEAREASSGWVLRPGAERIVRALARAAADATGLTAGALRVDRDRIHFGFSDSASGETLDAVLTHDAPLEPVAGFASVSAGPHGVLTAAAPRVEALAAAMAGVSATLPWERPWKPTEVPEKPTRAEPPAPLDLTTLRASEARMALRHHWRVPAVWTRAVDHALSEGRAREALALADAGRRTHPGDDDLAGRHAALLAPGPSTPLWPLALALAGAALLIAWARKPALLIPWLVAATAGALALGSPRPAMEPPPPLAPMPSTPCELAAPLHTPDGLIVLGHCGGKPSRFEIGERVRLSMAERIQADFEAAEALAVYAPAPSYAPDTPRGAALPDPGTLDRAEVALALALMVLGLLAVLGLWLPLARTVPAKPLVALLAVAVVLHVVMPSRLVMVYTGYDLTARLALLEELPRYGAGTLWLYGPVLHGFGVDHAHLQTLNRLFGVLGVVPVAALSHALVQRAAALRKSPALADGEPAPGTAWWVLGPALYVALPVMLRDHVSEAIVTGTALLVATGLAGLAVGQALPTPNTPGAVPGRSRAWTAVALAPLLAAATCRPEVMVAAPALLLAWRLPVPLVGVAMSLAGHAAWLAAETDAQAAEDSIRAPTAAMLGRATQVVTADNIVFHGPWVSAALLWLVAAAVVRGRGARGWALALTGAATLWVAATTVDLPLVSIPRVHAVALLLLLPVAALGASTLPRLVAAPLVLWVVVFTGLDAPRALQGSNADREDQLVRVIPADTACLVTVGFDDPPAADATQRHLPHYFLGDAMVLGIEHYERQRERCSERGPVRALLGTRCFMTLEAEPPKGGPLQICADFRARYSLEPETVLTIPNITDPAVTFEMWSDLETLDIGVYRVVGREGSGG